VGLNANKKIGGSLTKSVGLMSSYIRGPIISTNCSKSALLSRR